VLATYISRLAGVGKIKGKCYHSSSILKESARTGVHEDQTTKAAWVLTGDAFDRFLSCLDANVERAGEIYETIRQKLVKYFDWRGAHFPEDCADETINRVIRKLESGETIRDISTYCYGIARLVFLETIKKPERYQVHLDDLRSIPTPAVRQEENRPLECFERCLSRLPIESRLMILQYYQDERRDKINNRRAMADRLGIPMNALRCRVQRIRDKLEQCINKCLDGQLTPGEKK
jgi:DNA-directed RNA polymerase specialized sigma24 family protein